MQRLRLQLVFLFSVLFLVGCGSDDDFASFPYNPATTPALTALDPGQGPAAGGNLVVLSGTNLGAVEEVRFGTAPASFTVISGERIEAVAPAGSGNVQVRARSGLEISNALSYTYLAPAPPTPPTVTELTSGSGPTGGGNTVVLTGSGFTGATEVSFGTAPAAFTVLSPTQISAVAPAGTGTVEVRVVTPAGTSAPINYGYVNGLSLLSLSPAIGPEVGGTTVTLTGAGFTGTTAVSFGATPAASFTVDSDTQITATAPAGSGIVVVTVTTPAGTSGALTYAYVVGPTLSSLSPNLGQAAGGTTVVLTGSGFTGATAVSFGPTAATGFTVDSDTQITATAPAGTGSAQVTVTTPNGSSNGVAYTYLIGPILTSLSPDQGLLTGGMVILTGSGFTGATSVTFGAIPASVIVNSDTQITAFAPAGSGVVTVQVTTPLGASNTLIYTYYPLPILTSISPNQGPVGGGQTIVLGGGSLLGITTLTFGGTPATSFTVDSNSQITAVVPAGTGTVSVVASAPGRTSNSVTYTYLSP